MYFTNDEDSCAHNEPILDSVKTARYKKCLITTDTDLTLRENSTTRILARSPFD